jgi:hypothetical protein
MLTLLIKVESEGGQDSTPLIIKSVISILASHTYEIPRFDSLKKNK